jgi:hypothetical protein
MADPGSKIRKWRWFFLFLALLQVDTVIEAVVTLHRDHSLGKHGSFWGVTHYVVALAWLILGPALWWQLRPKEVSLHAETDSPEHGIG